MGCFSSTNKVGDQSVEEIRIKENKENSAELTNKVEQNEDDQIDEWNRLIAELSSNTAIDSYVKAIPRETFKTVDEVGEYLAKCPYARNEMEKAWLVFLWITEYIAYDIEGYKKGQYSKTDPQSVVTNGISVCDGYAQLFTYLGKRVGIECVSILGYAKGYGYRNGSKFTNTDHRWNAFRLKDDGNWRYVDSTWAASMPHGFDLRFEKQFRPSFFATPANIFNETHFTNELYLGNTHKSLDEFERATCEQSIDLRKFINLNEIKKAHQSLGLECLNQKNYRIK